MPVLPRRRLDQRVAGLDRAARLGFDDHRQRRPILDRAGGIVALELGQDDVDVAPGRRASRTSGVLPTVSARLE